jgi:hypothetical protein
LDTVRRSHCKIVLWSTKAIGFGDMNFIAHL